MQKIKPLLELMRITKPIGTLLLLWPTLWALWFATGGIPNLKILFVFIAGVIIMRAAGCVINDIADQHIDKFVARTQSRPLTSGKTNRKTAFSLFLLLLVMAFILVLTLNPLTIYLAVIGAILAVIYPFSKRYIQAPQFILGLAFAWGIPMAYAAILNSVPWQAWWLFLTTALWIIAYDTEYAMCDRADDLKIGIHSTAIWFGGFEVIITIWLQLCSISSLVLFGFIYNLNHWYYLALLGACTLFIYQIILIKSRQPKRCFKAFLNNHWVGLVIFIGIVLGFR